MQHLLPDAELDKAILGEAASERTQAGVWGEGPQPCPAGSDASEIVWSRFPRRLHPRIAAGRGCCSS